MTGEPNTLHLTDEQTEAYMAFCKHREAILHLIESGAFDLRSGTATLSFKDGILMDIEVKYRTYKRGLTPS